MLQIAAVVVIVAIVGTALLSPVGIAIWILQPLDRAARDLARPTQFTIADFLCLFFLIQLPTALIHGFVPRDQSGLIGLFDVFAWCACGAMWWGSVRTLSRAGVEKPWHRAVFLAVVLPIATAGAIAAPGLLFGLMADAGLPRELGSSRLLFFAGVVVLSVAVLFCGLFTRRMVAGAQRAARKP